ncbi:MAG: C39 family peptidase [Clostridiales bacterium]|nr:C39 family peptidase [Clostridiales bacterium]
MKKLKTMATAVCLSLLCGFSAFATEPAEGLTEVSIAYENMPEILPVIYYEQGSESPWASIPFGSGTIASSGSSVTSLAMVLTYLQCGLDENDEDGIITPDEVVKTIASNNDGDYNKFYVANAGQNWDIFPSVANYYGVNCEQIDSDSVFSSLQEGRPVIMACRPGILTSGGHFVVLTGYDEANDQIYMNDPNGNHTSDSLVGYSSSIIETEGKGWWNFWS